MVRRAKASAVIGSPLMRLMGLEAIYQSDNQCGIPRIGFIPICSRGWRSRPIRSGAPISTYIPVQRGFHLVAIMDWAKPRSVLAAIEHHGAGICVEALNEALARYGRPEPIRAGSPALTCGHACRHPYLHGWPGPAWTTS